MKSEDATDFRDDSDLVPISALNQYLFCPRRCALIHVEGEFRENRSTLEGRLLHDRADDPGVEERPGLRVERGLPLFSRRLGLVGKADVVEFRPAVDDPRSLIPYPVEYKRGKRRKWANDDVQVCAQALCLEEMLGVPVPAGAVFHAGSRRRREILLTPELRGRTQETVARVRELLRGRVVPRAVLHAKCDACSLRQVCMPEVTADEMAVARYMKHLHDL